MMIGSKTDLAEESDFRAVKTEDGEKLAEVISCVPHVTIGQREASCGMGRRSGKAQFCYRSGS